MKRRWLAAAILAAMTWSAFAQDNYSQWAYYRNIVLNTMPSGAYVGTSGSPVITHFPVLVRLSGKASNGGNANDSIVMARAAAKGADVRFSKWDGTHFRYQRERWDATNMYAEFWVLVDTVWGNDSVNASKYPHGYLKMYWGKSGTGDSSNGPAVFDTTAGSNMWGGGYQAALHLTDSADATVNNYYGYIVPGSPVVSTTGMIGLADSFEGGYLSWMTLPNTAASTDKLNFPFGGPFTLSAWVYPVGSGQQAILSTGDYRYQLQINGQDAWEMADWNRGWYYTAFGVPTTYTWHHLVGVRNNAGASPLYTDSLYLDGVLMSTTVNSYSGSAARAAVNTNLCIGADSSTAYHEWIGIIDEAEAANVARGANWVRLSYMNQLQNPIGSGIDALTIRGPALSTTAIVPATAKCNSPMPARPGILEVFLPNGARVMERTFDAEPTRANVERIGMKDLAKGYYTYRIKADGGIMQEGTILKK